MTTSTRRPAATPLLLPLLAAVLAAVLATSGCSFRGDVTQGGSSASSAATRSASSAATTAPTTESTSSRAAPPTSAPPRPSAATSTTSAPASTSASTSTAAPGGGAATPACRTADLRVRIAGGEGAAGSVYAAVEFVDTGAAACTLSGHPGVSYVAGQDGHQVGASAVREGTDLTPVVLAPGAAAHAQLRIVRTEDFDAASCRPTPVNGFRVYPPDQRASLFVPQPGTACASTSTPQLTIGPVQSGAATP